MTFKEKISLAGLQKKKKKVCSERYYHFQICMLKSTNVPKRLLFPFLSCAVPTGNELNLLSTTESNYVGFLSL